MHAYELHDRLIEDPSVIYEVTYRDRDGGMLLVATINAQAAHEALEALLAIPELRPPRETATIEIRPIGDLPPEAA